MTRLSFIDGEHGVLTLRGEPIASVAQQTFDETAAWMLGRPLDLDPAWRWAWEHRQRAAEALALPEPMNALAAGLLLLAPDTPERIIAATGMLVGLHTARGSTGSATAAGLPDALADAGGHAQRMLWLMSGPEAPIASARVRALDAYLSTVVEHGANASAFAARVVASTAADELMAVLAGLAALKGPLHGGAPGPVLDMLDAVAAEGGSEAAADAWVRRELAAGRRIMGMGHRVYRARDPRAAVLEHALSELESTPRLRLAHRVEAAAERVLAERHAARPLRANVEFYTATLLEALGIQRSAFTAIFAASRVVGWLAHIEEQRQSGRLMRPRLQYVPATPGDTGSGALQHG